MLQLPSASARIPPIRCPKSLSQSTHYNVSSAHISNSDDTTKLCQFPIHGANEMQSCKHWTVTLVTKRQSVEGRSPRGTPPFPYATPLEKGGENRQGLWSIVESVPRVTGAARDAY